MANNSELNAAGGGDLIATNEISGVHHQRVKLQFGADGSATDVDGVRQLLVIWDGSR